MTKVVRRLLDPLGSKFFGWENPSRPRLVIGSIGYDTYKVSNFIC